jgi:4-azaleucine resistance transporter AzlC
MIGVIPFGLVLGAMASQKGLTPITTPLMTGLNFAGGSEFAAIGLWSTPLNVALIVAITFLVNSRHLLMGAALAPFIRHLPRRRALPLLFLMVDESWALSMADTEDRARQGLRAPFSLDFYLGAGLAFYVVWVAFTAIGALVGPRLGDVETYGFDMAFPAVFLVLIRGMWKGWRPAIPWLVSLVAAGLIYLFVPGAWYVPAGAAAGLAVAWLMAGER